MNEELIAVFENLTQCFAQRKFADLRMALLDMEPADIALFMEKELEDTDKLKFFRMLPKEQASDVFIEIDTDTQEYLIKVGVIPQAISCSSVICLCVALAGCKQQVLASAT